MEMTEHRVERYERHTTIQIPSRRQRAGEVCYTIRDYESLFAKARELGADGAAEVWGGGFTEAPAVHWEEGGSDDEDDEDE